MSGGVDSTVSAAMLQEDHVVHGFFMDLGLPDREKHISRVQKVAQTLGIELHVIDLADNFQKNVVDYFCRSYASGITPNPCVICNPTIKCGHLLQAVRERGIEKIATGHYARIKQSPQGRHLFKGIDPQKDQSYFLCGLTQEQLGHITFPLGELTKTKVYEMARELGFRHSPGTESQDICFLANQRVGDFLKKRLKSSAGPIVTAAGETLGLHKGIFHYTIGQRKGLGICDATPYYVIGISAEKNQVIVGKESNLWQNTMLVRPLNWIRGSIPEKSVRMQVKIRYRHRAAQARVARCGELLEALFDEPQRAVTPGQFAVFYEGDEVLGGGEIIPQTE